MDTGVIDHEELVLHLLLFFKKVNADPRMGPTHIAVFTALFNIWIERGCCNPVVLFASEGMEAAKISSRITFRKIVRGLHEYGYLVYKPSVSKYRGSRILFFV